MTMGQVDQLARSTPAQLAMAWRHRDVLAAAAVTLVASAGHDPDVSPCRDGGCLLTSTPDEPMCVMARRLASLSLTPPVIVALPVAVAGFRGALTDAVDAVRACRQTAHPVGMCWFADRPRVDGCGEVLRLAHAAG